MPGLHRQFIFTGLRLGLYEEVKRLFAAEHGGMDEPVTTKVAAALAVSAAGISLANPSDVVKVCGSQDGWGWSSERGPRTHTCGLQCGSRALGL